MLSKNKNAVHILEQNIDNIDFYSLQFNTNPKAISILEKYISSRHIHIPIQKDDKFWVYLGTRTHLINIIEKNLDKINWYYLISNENAIHILEKNLDKVDFKFFSRNKKAIHILEKNLHRVDWYSLSQNTSAIHILEKNIDKIRWDALSQNKNAIHILEKNQDKINWENLSQNNKALSILSQPHNIDKINWYNLSKNLGLFDLDYLEMSKHRTKIIEPELLAKALHPSRVSKWLEYHIDQGYDICNFEY